MKGLILAAGIGSRLRPYTDCKPKCLLKIDDKACILDTQINSLLNAGVEEIIIVVGYLGNQIKDYIFKNYSKINVTFIENEDYLSTNNMYSFSLSESILKGSTFISMNADVVIDEKIIQCISLSKEDNIIAVDSNFFSEESMKVIVDNPKGNIIAISKELNKKDAFATSIDIYKIDAQSSFQVFKIVNEFLMKDGRSKWFEVALNECFREIDFFPLRIGDLKWYEIDNTEDLIYAKELFCV